MLISPSGRSTHIAKDTPQAAIIDRVSYVDGLARQAADAGARYETGRRVLNVHRLSDRVRVTLDAAGRPGTLEARMLVIAAGFGNALTGKLGLGRVSDYALGAQIEVQASSIEEVEVRLGRDVAPGFFAWVVPTAPGRALVGLMARRQAGRHLRELMSGLQTAHTGLRPIGPPRIWGIPLRTLERTVGDRGVVVGDAAGQVKPTTGGGIFYALLSSRVAARAIDHAFREDDLSEESLSLYETAWKALLHSELEAGIRMRHLMERLTDWQLDQIVGVIGSNRFLRGLLTAPEVSFDWHGKLAQKVLGLPMFLDSMKILGFADIWRRLTRVRV